MQYFRIKNKHNQIRIFSNEKIFSPKFLNEKFASSIIIDHSSKNSLSGGLRLKKIYKSNYENLPLISVIVPNFNGKNLKKTLDSILYQAYPNIEIILIDGGSNIENISFLENEYNDQIDFWISQKDEGIYDAWNKGIKLARGKYVGIINSNDYYYKDAFKYLIEYIKKYPDHDFILGAVKKHKVYAGFRPQEIHLRFNIYPSTVIGFFIKLESQKRVGLYSLKYKCSADYDMFYRIIKKHKMKGIPTKSNEVFGKFELGGFSSQLNFVDHLKEEIQIRLDNGQGLPILLYIIIGKSIMKVLRWLKIFN